MKARDTVRVLGEHDGGRVVSSTNGGERLDFTFSRDPVGLTSSVVEITVDSYARWYYINDIAVFNEFIRRSSSLR